MSQPWARSHLAATPSPRRPIACRASAMTATYRAGWPGRDHSKPDGAKKSLDRNWNRTSFDHPRQRSAVGIPQGLCARGGFVYRRLMWSLVFAVAVPAAAQQTDPVGIGAGTRLRVRVDSGPPVI